MLAQSSLVQLWVGWLLDVLVVHTSSASALFTGVAPEIILLTSHIASSSGVASHASIIVVSSSSIIIIIFKAILKIFRSLLDTVLSLHGNTGHGHLLGS